MPRFVFRFASREKIRLVENGLKTITQQLVQIFFDKNVFFAYILSRGLALVPMGRGAHTKESRKYTIHIHELQCWRIFNLVVIEYLNVLIYFFEIFKIVFCEILSCRRTRHLESQKRIGIKLNIIVFNTYKSYCKSIFLVIK